MEYLYTHTHTSCDFSNFRKNNICSKEECERLLSFTNNSGPLFIIGTVGILMYKNTNFMFQPNIVIYIIN